MRLKHWWVTHQLHNYWFVFKDKRLLIDFHTSNEEILTKTNDASHSAIMHFSL